MIAGIDYSINSPSICVYDNNMELTPHNVKWYLCVNGYTKKETERVIDMNFMKPLSVSISFQKTYKNNIERYDNLGLWAIDVLKKHDVDMVVIEDYSLGAKGLTFNIAEATGILKLGMHRNNISWKQISPSTNKKIFSGKGNSNKEKMVESFNRKYNIDITDIYGKQGYISSPVSDIVDSYSLIWSHYSVI